MSDCKREIDFTIRNATKTPVYLSNPEFNGPALLKNGIILQGVGAAAGAVTSKTLSASSTTQAVSGTLTLQANDAKGPVLSTITYSASSHSGDTKVGVASLDNVAGMLSGLSQGDHSITANISLYDAQAQSRSGAYVLSLGANPMSTAANSPMVFSDFVEQMFLPWIRSADQISTLISAACGNIDDTTRAASAPPVVHYVDFTGGQIATLVDMWTAYWLDAKAPCPAPDARLIQVFQRFLGVDSPPTLWLPQIAFISFMDPDKQTKADSGPAKFKLTGYSSISFSKLDVDDKTHVWNEAGVRAFLMLLASGAHMVSVSASKDNGGKYASGYDFYDSFKSNDDISYHEDQGSSHYAPSAGFNTSGSYYISITSDETPQKIVYDPGEPATWLGTLVAFMTGKTHQKADTGTGDYNGFMQLEGWQAHGGGQGGSYFNGGDRHHGDYVCYNDTLWNISTFGCSPYSEKRATSVFLGPPGWTPEVTQITCMMPYDGAYQTDDYTAQHWLSTYLVEIPSDAAAYDSKKYGDN